MLAVLSLAQLSHAIDRFLSALDQDRQTVCLCPVSVRDCGETWLEYTAYVCVPEVVCQLVKVGGSSKSCAYHAVCIQHCLHYRVKRLMRWA
jgi:hypothetical protein